MTTRASLAQLFGASATQDAATLTFEHRPGLTAEGVLAQLLARLLAYQNFPIETEQGQALTTENGGQLRGAIAFLLIEPELYSISVLNGVRVSTIFLGFNSENI